MLLPTKKNPLSGLQTKINGLVSDLASCDMQQNLNNYVVTLRLATLN